MIQFNKPVNLNGAQLLDELNAAGVVITEPPVLDGNNILWLQINSNNTDKATEIVLTHNGTNEIKVQTIEEKLASVGLSIQELKAALS
jgi:hypothetical protein